MAQPSDSVVTDSPEPSRWAHAVGGSSEAWRELGESYWYCAYAWWRRSGRDVEEAASATWICFGKELPQFADAGVERMREWLPRRCADLAKLPLPPVEMPTVTIDFTWAESRFTDEPEGEADAIFQRRWALTVLEFATQTLRAEYVARGEEALFAELLPFAGFEPSDDQRYSDSAERAGRTSGAMRKAVFDFRTRQRQRLHALAADTLLEPGDVESEITALLCACDAPGAAAADAPLPTAIRGVRPDEMLARAMQSVRMTSGGAGLWQPPSDEEMARLFPQYEMLGMLGRGGMGAVYKARQIELDRCVAIKLLPLEISVDRDFADRFRREARAMAKLNHPNIIAVYDFGTTREGHLYFVMEFVEGANLHDVIHRAGMEPAQALEVITGVCDALAYAHGKGIVHRDIKPANVMVSTESQVKVADFGLARLADSAADQLGHTVTGTVMGTPDYMAPEQKRGMNVDHRADIYSVGVMLYEALCRETPQGIFDPPSTRIGCDPRIDAIVIKAMQQAPDRRYQSTQEMKTDVTRAHTEISVASALRAEEREEIGSQSRRYTALPPPKPPAPRARGKESKKPVIIGITALVLALAAGAAQWVKRGGTRSRASQTSLSAATGDQGRARARSSELEPGAIRLWDTPEKIPGSPNIAWRDDALFITNRSVARTVETSCDLLFRCAVRLNGDAGEDLSLGIRNVGAPNEPRRYTIRVSPRAKLINLRVQAGREERVLQRWPFPRTFAPEEWLRVELRAVGKALTVSAEGKVLGTVNDETILQSGQLTLFADANGYFRDIVYVPLDKPDAAAVPAAAAPAPQTFGGHRYQLVEAIGIGWQQAKAEAEKMGGHLAVVTSQEEEQFIEELFGPPVSVCAQVWLGGVRTRPELTGFSWVTGESFTFQSWAPRNPDTIKVGEGLALMRNQAAGTGWNDMENPDAPHPALDRKIRGFIVEWENAQTGKDDLPSAATKDAPFVNSLGMKFVPVPITGGPTDGKRVLFSIWETRVQDYQVFATQTQRQWPAPNIEQGATHPAVLVNWNDAQAFCVWLTERERPPDFRHNDFGFRVVLEAAGFAAPRP